MKRNIIPIVAVLALCFAAFSVVRTQPARDPEPPPLPPPSRPFLEAIAGVGLVEANTENITIGTHLSGVVERVYVRVSQTVAAGEPLFKLDDRHLRATLSVREHQLESAKARVKTTEAMLGDAAQQLRFAERLSNPRSISAEELTRRRYAMQTAAAQLQEARAAVNVAQAEIGAVQTDIGRSTVRAPVGGEVLQVKLHVGEFAAAGTSATPFIVLGSVRPLHLRVDVDEHEAWRVRPEARASAFLRGNSALKAELHFVRFEPYVKKSLTGDSTERVDTRVLQVLYAFSSEALPVYVGQQMDVYIEAGLTNSSGLPERNGGEMSLALQGGLR